MVDLLNIARDIAKGCQYLEENQFIHRWFTRWTHSAYTPTLALRESTRLAIFLPKKQWIETNPKLAHPVLFAGANIVTDRALRRISDYHSHHNDSKKLIRVRSSVENISNWGKQTPNSTYGSPCTHGEMYRFKSQGSQHSSVHLNSTLWAGHKVWEQHMDSACCLGFQQ